MINTEGDTKQQQQLLVWIHVNNIYRVTQKRELIEPAHGANMDIFENFKKIWGREHLELPWSKKVKYLDKPKKKALIFKKMVQAQGSIFLDVTCNFFMIDTLIYSI